MASPSQYPTGKIDQTDAIESKTLNTALIDDPHTSPPQLAPEVNSDCTVQTDLESQTKPSRQPRKPLMAMGVGMQKTLTKTSILVNFLPTGTLLTFELLLPSVSGDRKCSPVSTMMINAILVLCALSCFFFHFTDSYREPVDKVYYGFVTKKGLLFFKPGRGLIFEDQPRLRAGLTDFIHAIMSVIVFVAIAFSDHRVTNCLFPGHVKEMDQVMQSFPLMVGVICSGLFLLFPNNRYGIGCMPT